MATLAEAPGADLVISPRRLPSVAFSIIIASLSVVPAAARADESALRRRAQALSAQGAGSAKETLAAFDALFEALGGAERASAADRLGAGIAALRTKDLALAERHLASVVAEAAGNPEIRDRARYALAVLRKREGRPELALARLTELARDRPEWSPTHYLVAVLAKLAQDGVPDPAAAATPAERTEREAARAAHARRGVGALEALLASGPEQAGMYYDAALYRLGQLLIRQGDRKRGAQLMREFGKRRRERGKETIPQEVFEEGTLFGVPEEPAPRPLDPRVPIASSAGLRVEATAVDETADPTADAAPAPAIALVDLTDDHAPEIVHAAPGGRVRILSRGDDGALSVIAGLDLGARRILAVDIDNDGRTDLVLAPPGGGIRIARNAGVEGGAPKLELDRYRRPTRQVVEVAGLDAAAIPAVIDLDAFDFDHDGDLDLLAVLEPGSIAAGGDGIRLLRNDADGRFADVTEAAGLAGTGPVAAVALYDPDDDVDLDLVTFAPAGGAPRLHANRRFGRFAPAERIAPDAGAGDFPYPFGAAPPWPGRELGAGSAAAGGPLGGVAARHGLATTVVLADLDGDGRPERRRIVGAPSERGPTVAIAADLDGDRRLDVVHARGRSVGVLRNESAAPVDRPMLRVALVGTRTNASAIGAVVEVLAGDHYARHAVRADDVGRALLIGLADCGDAVELVRVRWPNGAFHTVQPVLDVDPAAARRAIKGSSPDDPPPATLLIEEPKPIGSCPFFYTWDGERFRFLTDINGAGGIGLPTPEGMWWPFDEDEQLVIPRGALAPRPDGSLAVVVTEELLETTYVDSISLEAVDHPAGSEVVPDERFAFSPPPRGDKLHCLTGLRPARGARMLRLVEAASPSRGGSEPIGSLVAKGDGLDVTDAVAAADRRYALGFEARGGQWKGLAEPHALELDLGDLPGARAVAHDAAGASRLLLVLTGFLEWAEPATNIAGIHHVDPAFRPWPLAVETQDADGTWRRIKDDAGYPSGRQKAVVIDLTGLVDPRRPRVRLVSNRAIYWDRVAIATDPTDAPLLRRPLPLIDAQSDFHGISRYSYPTPDGSSYEDRIYEEPLTHSPFDHAPGPHTRYGDVTPLVAGADDRLVVLSGGDEVVVRFDPRTLPPPPEGWERDWVVTFIGYCKGADLNAAPTPATTPMPFRAMTAYPFKSWDERPADLDGQAAWIREWLTRSPPRRVVDLREKARARRR